MGPFERIVISSGKFQILLDYRSGRLAGTGDQLHQRSSVELEMIIMTHGHWDHFIGVADLKAQYPNAQIGIRRWMQTPCPMPN